jgi:alkylhydroperoxidase family enzyme
VTDVRVPPLVRAEQEPRVQEMLDWLRRDGDAQDANVFLTLARHPRLLKRWGAFSGTLLYRGELTPREREILVLRVGWLCRSTYEWGQHVPIGRAAGLTDEEIRQLADGPDAGSFTDLERFLIAAADDLHRDCRIGDRAWDALAAHYDDKQLIEICMVVGQYHLVAFTLNSLGTPLDPGLDGLPDDTDQSSR